MMDRRDLLGLGGLVATALAIGIHPSEAAAEIASSLETSPIQIICPDNYAPRTDEEFRQRLETATLDFLNDYWSSNVPIWNKPLSQIDMEQRLHWITHHVVKGVEENKATYPVDPIWIMAQMLAESYFCEFAVSPALAVGVAQFIPGTAKDYGMTVAGAEMSGLKRSDLRNSADEYYRLRREKSAYKKTSVPKGTGMLYHEETVETIIAKLASGSTTDRQKLLTDARAVNTYLDRLKQFDRDIKQAAKNYKAFIQANTQGRDIFNSTDANFLRRFDQRLLYKDPVRAMVKYIARNLRARNGNILAAAAGYNAGLGNTKDTGPYQPFGRVPGITETAKYVSHIVVNHYAISRRMQS